MVRIKSVVVGLPDPVRWQRFNPLARLAYQISSNMAKCTGVMYQTMCYCYCVEGELNWYH